MAGSLELPEVPAALEEIRRVVTVFRELRSGVTEDGRTKVKSPSGTLSTAEAISVVTHGLALAAHFGDGVLRPADVAAGIVGAVVKDPVADRVVWHEYLETVVRERADWARVLPRLPGRVRMTVEVFGIRHHGPGSARSLLRALEDFDPDAVLIEGPSDADALLALVGVTRTWSRRSRCWPTPPTTRATAAFWPFAVFSPGVAGDHAGRCGRGRARRVLRPARGEHSWRCGQRARRAGPSVRGRPAGGAGRRRPGTTTRSAGGTTSSSPGSTGRRRSRR